MLSAFANVVTLHHLPEKTALLFVDPYNDFLAEEAKLWPMTREVGERVGLHRKLRDITRAVRIANIPLFIVPHHRFEPGDFLDWKHATPYQVASSHAQLFARGSWGAVWHPDFAPQAGDVVVSEHFGSSGFANTNLDFLLRKSGVESLILIGLLAHTCVEGTARYASELGYEVTLVTDATAAPSEQCMQGAHVLNGPTFAHHIVTTKELLQALNGKEP